MRPVQPRIIGRLSECSVAVWLDGLVPGASVWLDTEVGGHRIDLGTADWPSVSFALPISLAPGLDLLGFQKVGFDTSHPLPVAQLPPSHVHPAPAPADLMTGAFATPLYEFATCVGLRGLFPGALVEVSGLVTSFGIPSWEVLGSGVVGPSGAAAVNLNRDLTNVRLLRFVQAACYQGPHPIVQPEPIEGGSPVRFTPPLPPPQLGSVVACGRRIVVEGLTPGADLTVTFPNTNSFSICSVWGTRVLGPPPSPFQPGQQVRVRQEFPTGGIQSADATATVSGNALTAPTFLKTPCTGQTELELEGLYPGAIVEIRIGSYTQLWSGAGGTSANPTVGRLPFDTIVRVRQNACFDAAGTPNGATWSDDAESRVVQCCPSGQSPCGDRCCSADECCRHGNARPYWSCVRPAPEWCGCGGRCRDGYTCEHAPSGAPRCCSAGDEHVCYGH
jgi:hypothetical protein